VNPRQLFGGLLSVILLLLFLFVLWEAFQAAAAVIACGGDTSCVRDARVHFGSPMEGALNTIGGLISAIVIAELAITKPTEIPAARLFAAVGAPPSGTGAKSAAVAYLSVWVLTGLAAYVWASLLHPDVLKPLTDYGNAWFGLAVASGYAYFGVNRGS
jgi:hypothetical protein